jgi:hypothetical protein
MMTDYYYYRLACEVKKVRPLTKLRFDIAYARFKRDKARSSEMVAAEIDPKKRLRMAHRWTRLAKVDALVHRGKILAGDDGPDLVAAGFGAIPPAYGVDAPLAPSNHGNALDGPSPSTDSGPFRRWQDDGPFPDAGAPGVREPRRPILPTLIGAAAIVPPMQANDAVDHAARQELFSVAV